MMVHIRQVRMGPGEHDGEIFTEVFVDNTIFARTFSDDYRAARYAASIADVAATKEILWDPPAELRTEAREPAAGAEPTSRAGQPAADAGLVAGPTPTEAAEAGQAAADQPPPTGGVRTS